MGAGVRRFVLVVIHPADPVVRCLGYQHVAGLSVPDGRGRGRHLAFDLLFVFPMGAPRPAGVRCGVDELGYCGRQCDRTDLHTVADQRVVLAGRFLSLWRLGLLWFVYWTAQASSRPTTRLTGNKRALQWAVLSVPMQTTQRHPLPPTHV